MNLFSLFIVNLQAQKIKGKQCIVNKFRIYISLAQVDPLDTNEKFSETVKHGGLRSRRTTKWGAVIRLKSTRRVQFTSNWECVSAKPAKHFGA